MTISKDLFLSILSMDAYNRSYGQGITGLSDATNTGIGTARIRATSDSDPTSPEVAAGFYAVAYDDPTYGTIISYRGTDGGIAELAGVDAPLTLFGSYQQPVVGCVLARTTSRRGTFPVREITHPTPGGALAGLALP